MGIKNEKFLENKEFSKEMNELNKLFFNRLQIESIQIFY